MDHLAKNKLEPKEEIRQQRSPSSQLEELSGLAGLLKQMVQTEIQNAKELETDKQKNRNFSPPNQKEKITHENKNENPKNFENTEKNIKINKNHKKNYQTEKKSKTTQKRLKPQKNQIDLKTQGTEKLKKEPSTIKTNLKKASSLPRPQINQKKPNPKTDPKNPPKIISKKISHLDTEPESKKKTEERRHSPRTRKTSVRTQRLQIRKGLQI